MVYSLTYRRPSRVSTLSSDEEKRSINESLSSGSSGMSHGIPEALSFDRIIAGGTCPPCTVRDFMNYLKYIEFSAENLQFYLWFRDYSARFAQLPESAKVLAPEWSHEQAEAEAAANMAGSKPSRKVNGHVAEALQGTDFADRRAPNPFNTPAQTPSLEEKRELSSEYGSSTGETRTTAVSTTTARSVAEHAFDDAGMKWKPFTVQPYRDEVNRVISVYIADKSPRELNLAGRERTAALHALQNTTHPSAFHAVAKSVEYSLRRQAHPNFVRWTICNGNRPRVVFARGLGVGGIVAGIVADLVITLSSAGRAWRVVPLIGWFIGIATLIAAWKGMCVVLHGMHHRHMRPWELFADETDEVMDEKRLSNDSFLSQSTNSFEDEPWIARYQKRNIIRKVFDREKWIQEPALRQVQDTIFLQAILGSFLLSCVFVGIFCAVPAGNFF
ncbi:hypothetical protein LTR37_008245 [Vermiconidia calcicola]|uniref:Uncharacterized protein n=1 Tax=Vermiconidia calcicola TaxID=1690605 RepID=A0ACC3NB41_9PEZI|nr:hypothetical protein LTR37_008245 [Vermiconidia calcicola]